MPAVSRALRSIRTRRPAFTPSRSLPFSSEARSGRSVRVRVTRQPSARRTSSAWEADDGSQALCFGNATPVDRTIAYRWNGAWTKMTLKPHELKLVHP